jgi:hypothetical protein
MASVVSPTAKRFHVGAVLDRVPSPRYFEGASHIELLLHGTPKVATAKRMVADLPSGASLALQLPASLVKGTKGALRHDTPFVERDLVAVVKAMTPRFAVLSSGVDLTPGPRDREALEAFAGRWREAGAPQLAWHAGGPWESEQAVAFAQKIGVVPVIDALDPVPFEGPVAYARVRAIGVHARLGDGTLARIAEAVLALNAADVYVAIESGEGPKRAKRLAQILAGESDGDGEEDREPDADADDDE